LKRVVFRHVLLKDVAYIEEDSFAEEILKARVDMRIEKFVSYTHRLC
jgi:hypothetical protein